MGIQINGAYQTLSEKSTSMDEDKLLTNEKIEPQLIINEVSMYYSHSLEDPSLTSRESSSVQKLKKVLTNPRSISEHKSNDN